MGFTGYKMTLEETNKFYFPREIRQPDIDELFNDAGDFDKPNLTNNKQSMTTIVRLIDNIDIGDFVLPL